MLNSVPLKRGAAIAGLALGGASIVASVYAFFQLLSTPTYLTALAYAVAHVRAGAASRDDVFAFAQLVGAIIAIIGALVTSHLLCYFGLSGAAAANATGAAQAPIVPPGKEIPKP